MNCVDVAMRDGKLSGETRRHTEPHPALPVVSEPFHDPALSFAETAVAGEGVE